MNRRYWLSNEAFSNYIAFVLGLVTAAIAFLAKRLWQKPDIVEVAREASVSLIKLEEGARQRLKITYEGRAVDSFHETTFRIRNRAGRVLEEIDPLGSGRTPPAVVKCVVEDNGAHHLHIKVPFLNPCRKYKDEITIRLYAPLQVMALTVAEVSWVWPC